MNPRKELRESESMALVASTAVAAAALQGNTVRRVLMERGPGASSSPRRALARRLSLRCVATGS